MSGDPDRYILYLLELLSEPKLQQPEYVNELSSNYRQSLRVSTPLHHRREQTLRAVQR